VGAVLCVSAGVLVCISPGTSVQIIVAILISLCFLKIYEVSRPFSDGFAGVSKNVAQWQIFAVFFLVLVVKEDALGAVQGGFVAALFIIILFANLMLDFVTLALLTFFPSLASKLFRHSAGNVAELTVELQNAERYALELRQRILKLQSESFGNEFSGDPAAVEMADQSPLHNDYESTSGRFYSAQTASSRQDSVLT
jgi:hypothetical protein